MPSSFVPDKQQSSFVPDAPASTFVPDKSSFVADTSFVPDKEGGLDIAKEVFEDIFKNPTPGIGPPMQKLREKGHTFVEEHAKGFTPLGFGSGVEKFVGNTAVDLLTPTTPFDQAATVFAAAGPRLYELLGKTFGERGATVVASKLAKMTPEESVKYLGDIAAAARGPEPIIKPVLGASVKETINNIVERQGRPRLPAEQVLLGLDQGKAAWRSLANETLSRMNQGLAIQLHQAKQISEGILEAVESGEIDGSMAARLLGDERMVNAYRAGTVEEKVAFRKTAKAVISKSGYILGQASKVAKRVNELLPKSLLDQLEKAEKMSGENSAWIAFNNAVRYANTLQTMAMTSNLRLVMRDFATHGARFTLDVMEKAMNGVLGVMTGKTPKGEAFNRAATEALSMFHNLPLKKNPELAAVMAKFPLEASKMMRSPLMEMTIPGRFFRAINYMHELSFTLINKAGAEAVLRTKAKEKGVSIMDLGVEDFKEAVEHGQKFTFSKNITEGPLGAILGIYRKFPLLVQLGQRFPRAWANLLKTAWEMSPVQLLNPTTYKIMSHPDADVAFGPLNRAIQGTAIWTAGMYMGMRGHIQGKWYKFYTDPDNPKRFVDIRSHQPFATGIAIGAMTGNALKTIHDSMKRGEPASEAVLQGLSEFVKPGTAGWSEMLVSMKRMDLTGLPLIDAALSGEGTPLDTKRVTNAAISMAANYLSGWEPSLLTRTVTDIMGQFNQKDRTMRYIRDRKFLGPLIKDVPFLRNQLPPLYRPISGLAEKDNPGLQHITGFVTGVDTKAEIEADRLGLKFRDLYPTTGVERLDNMAAKYMGPYIEDDLERLMKVPFYMSSNDRVRADLFKKHVNAFKSIGVARSLADGTFEEKMQHFMKMRDKLTRDILEMQKKK